MRIGSLKNSTSMKKIFVVGSVSFGMKEWWDQG